jgi:hypothetical protein
MNKVINYSKVLQSKTIAHSLIFDDKESQSVPAKSKVQPTRTGETVCS